MPKPPAEPALRIVIVGHVDHGKSTLIGRLFFDTGAIPAERQAEIERTCQAQGRPFELAYLMDALEEEREQNVTIETTQTRFRSSRRGYVIIDAPGHREFLKNMVTGASEADAAILIVDGEEGVREQTRRHAYILSLLGISQVVIAVNKLDRVGFDRGRFDAVTADAVHFLHSIGLTAQFLIPISAREGDNVVRRSERTHWYSGPTILEALDAFSPATLDRLRPPRMPVQDVYRWDDRRRYVGRVESGTLRRGDPVRFLPSGRVSRIRAIERWPDDGVPQASAGTCVGIMLEDEVYVEPGEVMAPLHDCPAAAVEVHASLFWMGREPLEAGRRYGFKIGTADASAEVVAIEERLDPASLELKERYAQKLLESEVGRIVLHLDHPVAADSFELNPKLGRFVLVDQGVVRGGGIVRSLSLADGARPRRVIRLDGRLLADPSGMLVDLRNESGDLELAADETFLARIRAGERIALRFAGMRPFGAFLNWAWEHFVPFSFRREQEGVWVSLGAPEYASLRDHYQDGPGI
ncbi:MAG: elongation factor Tu [Deltaproteobacteria bacterium]|nr:elongation factor Tu [Deltaproteobacteria bacterium]